MRLVLSQGSFPSTSLLLSYAVLIDKAALTFLAGDRVNAG